MRYCWWSLLILLGLIASAPAQVTIEVRQEQDQYLQGESMEVIVRITNLSGQTLHLGEDPDWLTFAVASPEGLVVNKTDNPPVQGEFDLESSKVAIKRVDIAPYFVFSHAGRFGVVATVRIKDWGTEIASRPRYFDIIDGVKIWEQLVGIPKSGGDTNSQPEVRRYSLQQANYLRGQVRLYLRVSDGYGKVVKVFPIGPMVSFGRPESPQVDHLSHLHVLYQNGPVSFSYTEFDPNGELVARRTYDYVNTRPHLSVDIEGNIVVTGGQRRETAHDVPPPKETATDKPAAAPSAPQTNAPTSGGTKSKTPTSGGAQSKTTASSQR